MNNPRAITEKVHQFNEERKEKGEEGHLDIETYDIKDFFTNI